MVKKPWETVALVNVLPCLVCLKMEDDGLPTVDQVTDRVARCQKNALMNPDMHDDVTATISRVARGDQGCHESYLSPFEATQTRHATPCDPIPP